MALTKDDINSGGSGGGAEEYGALSLIGADLRFAAKKPKVRFNTTYVASIRAVELQQQASTGLRGGDTRCHIVVSVFAWSWLEYT